MTDGTGTCASAGLDMEMGARCSRAWREQGLWWRAPQRSVAIERVTEDAASYGYNHHACSSGSVNVKKRLLNLWRVTYLYNSVYFKWNIAITNFEDVARLQNEIYKWVLLK